MSITRTLVLAAAGLTVLAAAVAVAPARAQTADVQGFLAAAALQPADVPSGMTIRSQEAVDPSDLDQLASISGDATAMNGILGGYEQTLTATDITSALFGQTAFGGVALFAFSSTAAAQAAQADVAQNGANAVQQLLSGGDTGITIGNVATLTPPAIGDAAQEFEITGTIDFGGQTLDVTLDVVAAQRGPVQFEAAAAGLQSERDVAEAMAAAVDTNVQANLSLLSGS